MCHFLGEFGEFRVRKGNLLFVPQWYSKQSTDIIKQRNTTGYSRNQYIANISQLIQLMYIIELII